MHLLVIVALLWACGPLAAAPQAAPKPVADGAPDDFTEAQRWLKQNQFAKAAAAFARFTRTHPADPRAPAAWQQEGVCHWKSAKPQEAARCWNWILQRYPASAEVPEALEQLIAYHQKRNALSEAGTLSARLIAQYPQHPAMLRHVAARAEADMAAQRYEEVVRLLGPLREHLPAARRATLERASLLIEARSNPVKLLAAADAALHDNEPAKAAPLLEAFLAKADVTTRQAEAKVKLGWAYYCLPGDEKDPQREKNQQRAQALWEEVVRKGPPTDEWVGESQWHLVQMLAGPQRKWQEAVTRLEQVARDFAPGTFRHEQALYTRAWLFWTQKQWSAGQAAFGEFVKAYPHKAEHPPIVAYLRDCEKNLKGKASR